MTAELKGIHAKTFQNLDVIKDVLKLDEEKIAELEKENAELNAKIYGGGYEAVIMKKDADIILLEHLLKEQKELHKSVCDQLTHTHRNLGNQLTKAKEIIEKLLEEEKNNMYWEMNGSDKSSYYEVRKQAEQFLKDCDIDNAIQQANKGLDFDKIADEMEQDLKDSEVEKCGQ